MRKYGLALAALGAGALALPSPAAANTDCSQATSSQANTGPGPVVVYADANGGSGLTGQGAAAAGVCADNLPTSPELVGGTIEVGAGDPGEVYAVVDGDDANTGGQGQAGGYIGVSTFETGVKDTNCDGEDTGTGSNSGGCLTIRDVASIPVPLLVCGNTTGKSFGASSRDGCTAP